MEIFYIPLFCVVPLNIPTLSKLDYPTKLIIR